MHAFGRQDIWDKMCHVNIGSIVFNLCKLPTRPSWYTVLTCQID